MAQSPNKPTSKQSSSFYQKSLGTVGSPLTSFKKDSRNVEELQAEFDKEINQSKQGAVILDEDKIDQENILGSDFEQEMARSR